MLEMMVAAAIFMTICGAVLSLLNVSQERYQSDSQVLSSFQEARLAVDQMSRDIGSAGYPPLNQFAATPAATQYATSPFAWSPSYPTTSCAVGTCTTPGNYDLIIETNISPESACVGWIRYQLVGTTLFRGEVCKTIGDPAGPTTANGVMVPYVTNVMNNASAAQIAALSGTYPGLFPGGNPVPIFTYTCDNGTTGPVACTAAGANNSPKNIRDVGLTLIVQAPGVDAPSGQIRAVSLNGRARRVNPNQ